MKREMMNVINLCFQKLLGHARSAIVPFAVLAMWTIGGACLTFAQQSAPATFSSAAEATQALFRAVQDNNEAAIASLVGGSTEIASSGDAAQDKLDREMFVHKYQEMHRLGRDADGSETLYIGSENWPFPIPLVEKDGAWHFDVDTGQREVMFRRIGENELESDAYLPRTRGGRKTVSLESKDCRSNTTASLRL